MEHRTIGRWGGDYSVLSRSFVPSVAFLVGQSFGEWVQFYSVFAKTAHAAGGNSWSVGIEFSGLLHERLTEWQILAGRVIHQYLLSLGIKPVFFQGGHKVSYFEGFLNHANVATSYAVRTDYIEYGEWAAMALGAEPAKSEEDDDDMKTLYTLDEGPKGVKGRVVINDNGVFIPADDQMRKDFDAGKKLVPAKHFLAKVKDPKYAARLWFLASGEKVAA